MHPLQKKIERLLADHELIGAGEHVLVGVSGGPDSMALLHLLAALTPAWHLQLTALYVDHGLRPAETGAEAELVRQAASRLGTGFRQIRLEVERAAQDQKKSLEHMARDLRYGAFAQVAAEVGAGKIVVAHTADDQVEEVLIRLLRGAGRGGLAGMRLMRDGRIVRPLLTTPKEEVLAYLQARAVAFAKDSSNADLRFLRNQVRLEVLPFLERYNPGLRQTLRRTAAILQDEEEYLGYQAEQCWQEVARIETDENGKTVQVALEAGRLADLHPALQRRLAERMLVVMAAQPDSRKIEQLLYLACHGQGGSQLHFSRGLRITKKGGWLYCLYPQGRGAGRGNLG